MGKNIVLGVTGSIAAHKASTPQLIAIRTVFKALGLNTQPGQEAVEERTAMMRPPLGHLSLSVETWP